MPMDVPPKQEKEVPLQFENLNKEWQQLSQQDNWDGFRIEAGNATFMKNLLFNWTLFMGKQPQGQGDSPYLFLVGPTYTSEDQKTFMLARVNLDKIIQGKLIQKVGDNIELKGSSQIALSDPINKSMYDASVEYTGSDWTAMGKLTWQSTLIANGAFTQQITPSLQMGGDLMFVSFNRMTIGQMGLRYALGKNIFTSQLIRQPQQSPYGALAGNSHELKMQYLRRVSDRLSLATDISYSPTDMQSAMSVGYEYTFRNARIQGCIDSAGKVKCWAQDVMGFGVSGMIDYVNEDYKFGFMMHIAPQPEQGQPGAPPV